MESIFCKDHTLLKAQKHREEDLAEERSWEKERTCVCVVANPCASPRRRPDGDICTVLGAVCLCFGHEARVHSTSLWLASVDTASFCPFTIRKVRTCRKNSMGVGLGY